MNQVRAGSFDARVHVHPDATVRPHARRWAARRQNQREPFEDTVHPWLRTPKRPGRAVSAFYGRYAERNWVGTTLDRTVTNS